MAVRLKVTAMIAGLLASTLLACTVAVAFPARSSETERERISLDGAWRFAIDPIRRGEADGFATVAYDQANRWDQVEVPHVWSLDPRWPYTGAAWYRREFTAPPLAGRHARLRFESVFARARVWLNGHLLGAHEGAIRRSPSMSAMRCVTMARTCWWWKQTAAGASGARPGTGPNQRLYPWWDYGGIVRSVAIEYSTPVYVANQRVIATPDLAAGTARIESTVFVRNASKTTERMRVSVHLHHGAVEAKGARVGRMTAEATVPAGPTMPVLLSTELLAADVRLWNLDQPSLYTASVELDGAPTAVADRFDSTFGIRSFAVDGDRLLLNGRPIRLGGANRPSDHPRYGLLEPDSLVESDLRTMKSAGMELQRIAHHAMAPGLIDAADRMGMLLIGEAGNRNLQPSQLSDEGMRADFRNQMQEVVERDWNHPSIIGWSIGNEYASDTPEGVAWTRDMVAFSKQIDPTRPVTFASFRADREQVARAEDEGSHHVDFISLNLYGAVDTLGARLDCLRKRYPGKAVFISEFGARLSARRGDAERARYIADVIELFRSRPWIAGAALWAFNDYRSRYPGSDPDGYRHWGMVDAERRPREALKRVEAEFAPVRITRAWREEGRLYVDVAARADFPSRAVSGLRVVAGGDRAGPEVPPLLPGGTAIVDLGSIGGTNLELRRADGSVMHRASVTE